MLYILLPAFNEELSLEPLLGSIDGVMRENRIDYEIVVVNDGSSDGTGAALASLSQRYPIRTITHQYNRGLGETARDGFELIAAMAAPEDVIVRMDCDDTHDPRYILTMLERLEEGWEVVIASRYAPGGGQLGLDAYRRTISRTANLLFKLVFPIKGVWEYTCGFRAYRAAVIHDALRIFGNKFIDLKGLGFTGTLEKLIKMRMIGARVVEIPFVLRYDKKQSTSKVVTSVTTLGCFVLMIKHTRYWGAEGQRWKRMIAERKARQPGEFARARKAPRPSLEDVRRFWNGNPLYTGESRHPEGTPAFFTEHERMTMAEHSGRLHPIFFRDVTQNSRVLDVGCGIGFWTERLSRVAAEVHACDLTEAAVALTRRRMELFDFQADVRVGNAEDCPYPDGSFDHINCQGVIHHTPDAERCVSEFARMLRPGGTLCLSVYYRSYLLRHPRLLRLVLRVFGRLVRLPGRGREQMRDASSPEELVRQFDGADNPMGRAYSRSEIEDLLGGHFRITEVARIGFPRRNMPFPLPTPVHRLLSRFLGLMIVVRCQSTHAASEPVVPRADRADHAQLVTT